MRSGELSIEINASCEAAFELIHDYSRRLEWDPFLRKAFLLNKAERAAKGVSSRCVARLQAGGNAMDTVYISFKPGKVAAVKMTSGPWFLRSFAATIRHEKINERTSRVTYHYHLSCWPGFASYAMEPVVEWVFRRETKQRLVRLKEILEKN